MMHVAITGASSGIGEALAREFAKQGSKVTLVARRQNLLESLAADLRSHGTEVCIEVADLCLDDQMTAWMDRAEAKLGPIDVLINNAGMQIVGPTPGTPIEEGERLVRLDLLAPFRMTLKILPRMTERKQGTIVDIASLAALAPTPGMYYYNAAKAGLGAASESLRGELKNQGVHVVTVYPGPVQTAMAEASFQRYGSSVRWIPTGTPQGLASQVFKAVKTKKSRVIYPSIYHFARWFPGFTRWAIDTFTPPLTP